MKSANYKGYTVFEDGRVIGLRSDKFLKPGISSNGYPTVSIYSEGKNVSVCLHRLVAECFLPKVEGKTYVNHIDNNKLNNHVSNLEWCTPSENSIHMVKIGRAANIISSVRSRMSKSVIDTSTGKIYDSCKQAAKSLGHNENTLRTRLCGFRQNTTTLKYMKSDEAQ